MKSFYAWQSENKHDINDVDEVEDALGEAQEIAEDTMEDDPEYYGDKPDNAFLHAFKACAASKTSMDYTTWMDIVHSGNNDAKPAFMEKARAAGLDMACVTRCTKNGDGIACAVPVWKPLDKKQVIAFFGT